MKIHRQYRQGDVLLHPIQSIPKSAQQQPLKGDIILAVGEATGHDHRIKSPRNRIRQYLDGPVMYLEVIEAVALTHQEHGDIVLEPGNYERRIQTETWLDEVRQVRD